MLEFVSSLGSGKSPVVEVGTVALLWLAMYQGLKLCPRSWFGKLGIRHADAAEDKKQSYALRSRFVGMIHAVLSLCLAVRTLFYDSKPLKADKLFSYTPRSQFMVTVSSGFFTWDLGLCLTHLSIEGYGLLLHAAVCWLVSFTSATRQFLQYHGSLLLFWESSTLFLHVKWALEQYKLKNTTVYIINGSAFMITFFLARVVMGFVVSFDLWASIIPLFKRTDVSTFLKVLSVFAMAGNLGLSCLNLFWLRKMGKFVIKALKHAGLLGGESKGKGLAGAVGELDDDAVLRDETTGKKNE
mmetsp:Transcript_11453/g.41923  ORF Transcript_11453/g.41923 Transcript_11453/m.41923 type:complete len:298 (+) Transcript_11453:206-1099(+)